jgi:hypothetical protein
MDAVLGDVEPRPDEPLRPLRAIRDVQHSLPGLREREPEVVDQLRPKTLGLLD